MAEQDLDFNRANFFPGMLATPKFWNDMQGYLYQKEQFHNKTFHGQGVIPGVAESLRIETLSKGSGVITLVVQPGVAIDGHGRAVYLTQPQAVILDYRKFKIPGTVYVVISYNEKLLDYFQNQELPDLQGYQRRFETASVDIVSDIKDPLSQVELSRVYLQEDENGEIREVKQADNFASPGANALDIRYVGYVTPARQAMSPHLKEFFVELLDATRNTASAAYDAMPMPGLRELQTVSMTGKMLVQCGDVSFGDLIHVLYPLFDINNQVLQEMMDHEREEEKRFFTGKPEFESLKSAVFQMGDQIKYFDQKYESLDSIMACQRQVIDAIKGLMISRQVSLESISLISYDLPRVLLVEDERYTLVDFLDMGHKESVLAHGLEFIESKDVSTVNQSATYPDGVIVRDTLKRYVGGVARFSLKNIVKRRKLMLIRRTDIYHGSYSVDVSMNDNSSRSMMVDGADTKNRWRNLIVSFSEDEVLDNMASIEFRIGDKGRDNMGRIWAYQCL